MEELRRALCWRLGIWYRPGQRTCPHPAHRRRSIHGDERNYGYLAQCMDCGKLWR